jgi:hypothetical protein
MKNGRVLVSQGRRVRLQIACELLNFIVIQRVCKGGVNKSNRPIQNPSNSNANPEYVIIVISFKFYICVNVK